MDSVIKYFFACWLLLFTLQSYAAQDEQFLIVSACLLSNQLQYESLAKTHHLELIKVQEWDGLQNMRRQKGRPCSGFINVTPAWQHYAKQKNASADAFLNRYLKRHHLSDLTRRYKIAYQAQVTPLLDTVEVERISADLATLTGFSDRYADSLNGLKAETWIKQQVQHMAATAKYGDVSVYEIPTLNQVNQPSIVLKLGAHLHEPGILLGAHMDTLQTWMFNKKPGADNDASGVSVLLEAARSLLNSDIKFSKPIYFVWYAASEEGGLGAQSVIQTFNRNKITMDAVLQFDMTGYENKENPGIGLVDDFTDSALTRFIADLATTYLKQPVGIVRCGYACSDHMLWYLNGNRVAYPFETMDDDGNRAIYTPNDVINKLSLTHIADFVKLAIAFAVETGEPIKAKSLGQQEDPSLRSG